MFYRCRVARTRWAAVGIAVLLLGILGLWATIGDVPFLTWPTFQRGSSTAGPISSPSAKGLLEYELDLSAMGIATNLPTARLAAAVRTYFDVSARPSGPLWDTLAGMNSPDAYGMWKKAHEIQFPGFSAWQVPGKPSWSEDPFHSSTWQFDYQSLGWIQSIAYGYEVGASASDRATAIDLILSWIRGNPRTHPPSSFSWYDHSVALRTDTLVALYSPLLRAALSPGELAEYLSSLHEHGQVLRAMLDDPQWKGHNHGFYHAMALYNLAVQFPEFRESGEWKRSARARLSGLLTEMVEPKEGASLEQASSYQFVAINLFDLAGKYLAAHDDSFDAGERSLLARMVEFGALLTDPNGLLPAVGDTSFGAPVPMDILREAAADGFTTPAVTYLLSHGTTGQPPPTVEVDPQSGYALVRSRYTAGEGWADDPHLVVDMGPTRRVHGHDDAMNILLAAGGRQLLVDSGGPFIYDDPRRVDFVRSYAHNTVVVDGATMPPGDAHITRWSSSDSAFVIEGRHTAGPSVSHDRAVILLQSGLVLVIDELKAEDGGDHRYDVLWHFPPDASVESGPTTAEVIAGAAELRMSWASTASTSAHVVRGQTKPYLLGWVTPGYGTMTPAPVLDVAVPGETTWVVTAVAAGRGPAQPEVSASSPQPGRLIISVSTTSGTHTQVDYTYGGTVSVGGEQLLP